MLRLNILSLKRFPQNLGRNFLAMFSKKNIAPLSDWQRFNRSHLYLGRRYPGALFCPGRFFLSWQSRIGAGIALRGCPSGWGGFS